MIRISNPKARELAETLRKRVAELQIKRDKNPVFITQPDPTKNCSKKIKSRRNRKKNV